MTISASRGSSTSMSLRLCSRAPEMTIRSEAATHSDSRQANSCSLHAKHSGAPFARYPDIKRTAVTETAAELGGAALGLRLPQARQPGEEAGQVPVALTEQLHRRRQHDRPHDRGVDQDRDREADAHLLHVED